MKAELCEEPLCLHGGVGRSVGRPHRVVKHQVVPAHGREGVGAALKPADVIHKVLVPTISESAHDRGFSVCGRRREDWRVYVWRLTLAVVQSSGRQGSNHH